MLSRLTIHNYALIKSLDMQPHAALNIITGETGAGKSIMLGAVGLLLGNRADSKVLYDQDKKCIIEGAFDIKYYNLASFFERKELDYDTETLIRREITPSGKSRAFINDTPVTLDVLKELGSQLMDVHSQHQTLLLASTNYQLRVVDIYADTGAEFHDYQQKFKNYTLAKEDLTRLLNNAERIAQESDYNSFLLKELVEAKLAGEDQTVLEEGLKVLEHAEEIKSNLITILAILDKNEHNGANMLREAKGLMGQISDYSDQLHHLNTRLEEAFIEVTDIISEVEHQEQMVEVDFGQAEEIREKLSLIYHLQNKHHVTDIAGLLAIQEKLEEETFIASHLDEEIATAKKNLAANEESMLQAAQALSKKRQSVFIDFERELTGLLVQLGMPDAKLELSHQKKDPSINGIDDIELHFSANKGVSPAPLNKVASGGEFSRLMFCLKYVIANKTALPTMVFDEIDAGISGEIALQMGKMMQKMALGHQVITISHLPQIAAKGKAHFFVYKENELDRSISKVRQLNDQERIKEIAKMIGGDNPSDNAFKSAKELVLS